ncbi:hypothetical protein B0J14DRAFT_476727 [Halenospora varia]|nr:hypothetical protein B0J14DRAFT_476727 [Halenospora varia]
MVIKDLGDGGEYNNNPEYEQNARNLRLRMIKPHMNPEYIVQNNPTYCGLLALNIVVANEKAGLLLNNYHTVVTLVAHLYSEARRANILTLEWPEMDQMIEMHKDTMFAGTIPQSASEAYIRYQKLMGLSTDPHRPASHARSLPYKEPQYRNSPFSDTLRPFFERGPPFNPALERLEALVQKEREAVHHESKHKCRVNRRKLTPLQFLMQLKDFVPAQMSRLQFDYITLTKTCYMLMKKFHSEIKRVQNVEYPLYTTKGGDSIQPLYPYMVLGILRTAKERDAATRGTPSEGPEDSQMGTVAAILKKYLEVRAGVAAVREGTMRY